MAYKITISPKAEADLASIEATIARDNPAVARRHGDELVAQIESRSRFPFRGSRMASRRSLRRLLHGAYLIIYQVCERSESIEIYRVWHGARDPASFRLREAEASYSSTFIQASP